MGSAVVLEKQERYFQKETVSKTFEMVINDKECHPIAALPTASGKSYVIALLIDEILSHNPRHNILVLCDREEILAQDHEELESYFGTEIGLYSAGLDSRTIKKITVAGIQSMFKKHDLFSRFDFVIIDECDSVNDENNSRYRIFLKKLLANYIGLTATPYGLKGGYLHEGKNALFNCISVDYTRGEKFLQLQNDGYLAKIFSIPTKVKFDEKKLSTLAGDFSLKSQSEHFDVEETTEAAILETIYYGANFKRWLLFAIDIKHAENISDCLTKHGISNCVIHSKMEGDRKEILKESKRGVYRAIVNVDVLTIGYNDPLIDLVGLYFATKSPRKHVQTGGRLLRPHPDIEYKLILDFGGNFMRMGPLNEVKIKSLYDKKKTKSEPMMKQCSECNVLNYLSAKICCNCEHEFPVSVKLKSKADMKSEIVKTSFDIPRKNEGIIAWANVTSRRFERKSRRGHHDFIKITYLCGLVAYTDYLYPMGNGWSSYYAKNWMDQRWLDDRCGPVYSVSSIMLNQRYIALEKAIRIDTTGKEPKIVDVQL